MQERADIERIAEKIIDKVKGVFVVDYPFLSYSLGQLNPELSRLTSTIGTDGTTLEIDAKYICWVAASYKSYVLPIMHTLLHCVFLHPFSKKSKTLEYNLGADISVFVITDEMGIPWGTTEDTKERRRIYQEIKDQYGFVNQKTIGKYCSGLDSVKAKKAYYLFKVCDHSLWYNREKEWNVFREGAGTLSSDTESILEEMWKNIAKNIVDTTGINAMDEMISVAISERYDYAYILRRFLQKTEKVKINQDEFDYIFYSYGLSLYKNIPLIESLEYSNDLSFLDIAVAIDTSGSTKGEPVRRFLEETYSIINQIVNNTSRLRLHLIQCDDHIVEERSIQDKESFVKLMDNYELKGGGGTDFRPVFDLLIAHVKNGMKLNGLIYFTDGKGIFPVEAPPFKTIFILHGKEANDIKTPAFAYRMVLSKEAYLDL